jgi:TonB-dependent starch-binding outer membrane protein SusC
MQKLSRQKIVTSLFRSYTGRLLFVLLSTACLLSQPLPALAQEKTIKGRVTSESGTPVAGATVSVKGSTKGTSTNAKGEYTLSVSKGAVLVISNVGYTAQEINVGDDTELTTQLKTTVQNIDEVVVIGYGSRRKKDLTGAVASVNLEAFDNAPNVNIGQFMQGTVPGLNVGLSTYAGGTPPIGTRTKYTQR